MWTSLSAQATFSPCPSMQIPLDDIATWVDSLMILYESQMSTPQGIVLFCGRWVPIPQDHKDVLVVTNS